MPGERKSERGLKGQSGAIDTDEGRQSHRRVGNTRRAKITAKYKKIIRRT